MPKKKATKALARRTPTGTTADVIDASAVPAATAAWIREQLAAAQRLVRQTADYVVKTDAQHKRCAEHMRALQSEIATIEAKRKEVVEPLYRVYDDASKAFAPLLSSVKESLAALKSAYGDYSSRKRAEERRAMAAAVAKSDKREIEAIANAAVTPNEGVSETKVARWRLHDPQKMFDLGFMVPDVKRIDEAIRRLGTEHPLAKSGAVEVYFETSVRVRK